MLNRFLAKIIALLPQNLVWIFSKRYIAGKELKDALRVSRELNAVQIKSTIDVLGEYIQKTDEAIEYKRGYLHTIEMLKKEGIDATLSVKPSMFGLLLDEEFCYQQLKEVMKKAGEAGLSVCMDMEDSSCTQMELNLFEKLYKEFPGTVSIVLQAYLHRTLNDLQWLKSIMLPEYPINVRICKGIYIEPEEIAYQGYQAVNKNFEACIAYMLDNGFYSAIATHDKRIIASAKQMLKQKAIDGEAYEFQMLYGVRPALRNKLVKEGHDMRVYVPYGTHWYGYSTRRLKENPRMITHIIKALIFRG
ncbi:MAG: proline dehydrogenase family protein [Bacteroidota bacterium]|nr:MAG: proline dehydrogenase family protein [Bacteroidota bacterium]